MIRKLLFVLIWVSAIINIQAQTDTTTRKYRLTTEGLWLSVGHSHTYDNYLSSQLYKGISFGAGMDQTRFYSADYQKISKYDGMDFHAALEENAARNSRLIQMYYRGFYGAHYHIDLNERVQIMPGAYTDVELGLKYLPHNGNNPVNVIGSSSFWLSARWQHKFKIGKEPFRIIEHPSISACGIQFSPKYTQLYYDIAYIDDYDGNIVFTHFGNKLHFRNDISVDFPIGEITRLRVGMTTERMFYDVSNLKGRLFENALKIGIVRRSYVFKGKTPIPEFFVE
ncbi:MAG: DUF3316 domain-containing protein [Paludibacteraceae bacterium]|nr:DUF3316 domain-containing protein [Paludibacteraceae bacterium]